MKKKVIRLSVKIALIIAVLIGFVIINELIYENKKMTFKTIVDDYKYIYQIEDMYFDEENIVLKGFFFELQNYRNQDREISLNGKLGIVLFDINSIAQKDLDGNEKPKMGLPLNVEYGIRVDIDDYFKCEYDYSKCGFTARTKKENLNLENGQYLILFKPDEEDIRVAINSNTYINNGQLVYINPKNIVELEVEGTDIEKIVKEGICVASSPKDHVFIYQYGWKLYWIVDNGFVFEKDGSTCIQYHIDTTQYSNLPKNRIEKGNYWDNLGADFEKYEITNSINCGKYRVYVRDIPSTYSVTRITTGYYADEKWKWQIFFRPIYSFK